MHPYDKLSHPNPLARIKAIRSHIDDEERQYMEQQAHIIERLSVDFSSFSLEQLTAFIEDPENGFDDVHVTYERSRSFVDGSPERGGWQIDNDGGTGSSGYAPTFRDALEKMLTGHRNETLRFLNYDLDRIKG